MHRHPKSRTSSDHSDREDSHINRTAEVSNTSQEMAHTRIHAKLSEQKSYQSPEHTTFDPLNGLSSPRVEKAELSKMPTTITNHITLDIHAQPGVAIEYDVEKKVRAIKSLCQNFIWGGSEVCFSNNASEPDEPGTLRIILIHNDENHNGNLCSETINAFRPTIYDQRDLVAEKQEVMSVDEVVTEIRGWKDKVQSCYMVGLKAFTQNIGTHLDKGGFPNGMGNSVRYPAPWDANWEARRAERDEKQLRYEDELE